jgi:hypothetical protein
MQLEVLHNIVYIARNSIAIEDFKCICLMKAETFSKVLLEITNVIH